MSIFTYVEQNDEMNIICFHKYFNIIIVEQVRILEIRILYIGFFFLVEAAIAIVVLV